MTPSSIQQLENTFGLSFWEDDYGGWTCRVTSYTILNVDPKTKQAVIQTDSRKGMAPEWVHTVKATKSQTLEFAVRQALQLHLELLESETSNLKNNILGRITNPTDE